jgi:exopolysaccharide biosynthesis polyprenyl glycosylphosphotransferase
VKFRGASELRGASRSGYAYGAVLIGLVAFVTMTTATALQSITALAVVVAVGLLGLVLGLALKQLRQTRGHPTPARVAVIGSMAVAQRLRADLEGYARRFSVVGRIALPDESDLAPALADIDGLRQAVLENDIRLLILSSAAPRLAVYDQLVSHCLDLPVKVVELPRFYEAVFGYVPVSELNVAWFHYLLDPDARTTHPHLKRAIDLVGAALLGIAAVPLCAILMMVIRRDGGPAIFRQERIGEGGRRFTLYKLRTMRPSSGAAAQWAAANDPRVTRVGRVLRATHVDELPQLLNVLRGEMSLVGPRPEQPAFVDRLEREVPFYDRRHLVKPGITGWAQIRCGYARSESASIWKHCHDLYYLKHRSIAGDLHILMLSVRLAVLGAIRGTEVIVPPTAPDETVVASAPREHDAAPLTASRSLPTAPS